MKNRFFKASVCFIYTLLLVLALGSVDAFAATELGTTVVTAFGVNNGAFLEWNEVEGATGYRVYQRSEGKWKKLASVSGTQYTADGLENTGKYTFAVKAYSKQEGKVVMAKSFGTVKIGAGLAKPVVRAAVNGESVTLDWDSVFSAKGYRVYQYKSGKWKPLKTTSGNTYTVSGLSQGKEYRFAVRAYVKSGGENIWSDYSQVIASIPVYTPSKVTGVSVTTKGTYLEIKWTKSAGAAGYNIYKSETGKSKSYKLLATTKSASCSDKAVEKAKDYYYIIKAYSVYDGKKYYSASSKKVKGTVSVEYKNEKGVVYAKNNVVIREKAKSGAKILGTLGKNSGILQLAVGNNGWTRVRYTGNKTGYISSRFLTEIKPENNPLLSYNSSNDRLVVDPATDNWKLVVVNAYREFTPSYKPRLTEVFNTGIYLDYRVTPYYEKMYTDAKKEGIYLTARSGYRTYERQKELFETRVEREMRVYGLTKQDAIKKASRINLPPGTSEHNLGIAMDISNISNYFKNSKEFRWLQKNAHKYGFILRYTENNTDITGIIYEPWHWRFVGVENAEKIKKSGLTLEQYLDKNKIPY